MTGASPGPIGYRGRARIEADVDEEIEFHLEMRQKELERRGYAPAEARAEALRLFGDRNETQRVCYGADVRRERTMRRTEWWLDLRQDLKLGLRQLWRRPAFTAAVVLTLGVGIGAATAVFGAADHVLLRPLPYDQPDRVVALWETDLRTGERREVTPGNFLSWQERSTTLESIGLAEPWGSDLVRADAPPEELPVWRVSDGFLDALGVRVVAGRGFAPEEFEGTAYSNQALGIIRDHSGTGEVVLISEGFWRSRYGADSTVIGTPLDLDGVQRTVVGVVAAETAYPEARPIWAPKLFSEWETRERTGGFMSAVGRLRPGVTLDQARVDMDRVARELADAYPGTNADMGIEVVPLDDQILGGVRPALLFLLGAVALVLAVACANVAGLMLARGSTRRREVSVRAALGAGRARLVRQLLAESLVLGVLAGAVGLGIAALAFMGLTSFATADIPRLGAIGLDGRVLGFAAAVSVGTALLAGLLPAWRTSRPSNLSALADATRGVGTADGGDRLRRGLVVAEVAVSLALLVAAGLLGRSFVGLLRADLGFRTEDRVALQVYLWDRNPTPQARLQRADEIVASMETDPSVSEVAIASSLPFHPFGTYVPQTVVVQERPPLPPGQQLQARVNMVSSNLFEVLGIPLLAGRAFDARDRLGEPVVAIVNNAMAESFFPGEDPIGERLTLPGQVADVEIVGVVAGTRQRAIEEAPSAELFLPFAQTGYGATIFVARTRGDAGATGPGLRQAVWDVDAGQSIYHTSTLDALVRDTLGARRFSLLLLGTFALLGLVLSVIGIYGAISYSTSLRTREIGIRIALGSTGGEVSRLILHQGLAMGALGVLLGVPLARFVTRYLGSLLYRVGPADLGTFAAVSALMLALVGAASWIPARRGARLEPVRAMRDG